MTDTDRQVPLPRRPILEAGKGVMGSLGMLRRKLRFWGLLVALVFLCVGFSLADPSFATVQNMQTIANRAAVPLVLAVGMTFILIQGSIDLSIEGIMGVSSLAFAMVVLNSRPASTSGFSPSCSRPGPGPVSARSTVWWSRGFAFRPSW